MYHHFPSKTQLFRAAWEASERDNIARLAQRAEANESAFEALRAGCLEYLQECASNRELQRVGLRQSRAVLGWEEWSAAAASLGIGVMEGGVRAAVASGELATTDVGTTARVLLAALIEAGLLIATAEDSQDAFAEVAPEAMRLVDGLRVR
jgi:AcrR family transcriptional regulator